MSAVISQACEKPKQGNTFPAAPTRHSGFDGQKSQHLRNDVVIATKVFGRVGPGRKRCRRVPRTHYGRRRSQPSSR